VDTTTHAFRIGGMHCGSCALLIDDALADLPGVRSTRTTVRQRLTTVELDVTQSSPTDVVQTIEGLGYHATPLS
jgi:copper chaperone